MNNTTLSTDERELLTHVSRWGSDGYPVRRVGSHHWAYDFHSIASPRVYSTKREAVQQFEAYLDAIRDRLAGRAGA